MRSSSENKEFSRSETVRAGVRLNSRVNLNISWSENGANHTVPGYTVDVSSKGCLAIAPQGFVVGQKLQLHNPLNGHTAAATLVWRGHEGRTGWELGLQLDEPAFDFWGIDF